MMPANFCENATPQGAYRDMSGYVRQTHIKHRHYGITPVKN